MLYSRSRMLLLYIYHNRYLIVRKPNTRFNADIAFVMEIAYDAVPLKRLRFFMQFPRQALYGHGNAG